MTLGVRQITIKPSCGATTVTTYPIAVANGGNAAGADAFVQYVLGEGQATLAKYGFLPPT